MSGLNLCPAPLPGSTTTDDVVEPNRTHGHRPYWPYPQFPFRLQVPHGGRLKKGNKKTFHSFYPKGQGGDLDLDLYPILIP